MLESFMSELKVIMMKGHSYLVPADNVTAEYMDELPASDSEGRGISYLVTITPAKPKQIRTAKQRAGIEVYCRQCAAKCLEGGIDLKALISFVRADTIIPVSQQLFKDVVFKGIQVAMKLGDSTTKLTTSDVSDVYMVVNKFTSERLGFSIPWPSNRSD